MNKPVEGKQLVQRFNRYVEYRKTVEKTGASFTEQLSRAEVDDRGKKSEGAGHRKIESRAGRRHMPPRLGRSKHITTLQANRLARYAPVIEDAARRYNVPVELICGVILQESGGNSKAVSHAGARGLMQLMPGTAKRFGVENSFDPAQNIDGGTRYLRWLFDRFNGNIELALAGYNAGEHNVEKYGNKIPPFRETQNYIPNVLGYTQAMIDIFLAKANGSTISLNRSRA